MLYVKQPCTCTPTAESITVPSGMIKGLTDEKQVTKRGMKEETGAGEKKKKEMKLEWRGRTAEDMAGMGTVPHLGGGVRCIKRGGAPDKPTNQSSTKLNVVFLSHDRRTDTPAFGGF